MTWHLVPPDLATDLWPAVAPLLQRGIDEVPIVTLDDVLAHVLEQRADLLVLLVSGQVKAALVIEVHRHPGGSVANVWLMGGEPGFLLAEVGGMEDATMEWARAHDCSKIMFTGRPGWSKFEADRGWHTRRAIIAWKALP